MWYFTSKLYSICECDEQHRLFGLSGWWVQYHFYFPVQIQARHLCACVFVVGGRRRQPPTSRGLGHRPPAASEQKIECATTRTHARSPHLWMAMVRFRLRYSRVLNFAGSSSGMISQPRFLSSGPEISSSVSGLVFHPWIPNK